MRVIAPGPASQRPLHTSNFVKPMNEDQKAAFARLHAIATVANENVSVAAADVRALLDAVGATFPAADATEAPAKKK
jgi:hypothetical protein